MKHLIIYAHPRSGSLNHHLLQTVLRTLGADGTHEVVVRDLYQLGFNPVLSLEDMALQRKGTAPDDVLEEQRYLAQAELITIIHPIWWTGMPALMKGYIDRVMSYGFAYRYDQGVQKGLLTGKQVIILNTQGKSQAEYEAIGMDKALSLTSDRGVYTYCGLEVKAHLFLDKADRATPERVEEWTRIVENLYR